MDRQVEHCILLNIYNYYRQDLKKFKEDSDCEETICILQIGVKNCGEIIFN